MSLSASMRQRLKAICGPQAVFDDPSHRHVYEADAYAFAATPPRAVVLPRTPEQVVEVIRCCRRFGVSFAPRGAGTGLSGGCVAVDGGIQIGLSRLNKILEIDPLDRIAVVQPGVVNQELSDVASRHGLEFAPDPSSQVACTVAGNFAENAGGPHTLKYGVTLPHVLGAKIVTPDGELVELGGRGAPGRDSALLALQCGAEGTLGVVVELTLRLTPSPLYRETFLAVFDTPAGAAETVRLLVRSGTVPAAMEFVDRVILDAVEAAFELGVDREAGAILILEVDGQADTVAQEAAQIRKVCEQVGVRSLEATADEAERARLWRARKHAFGAVGRLSPDYATQDGVVPRESVPEIVRFIAEVAERHQLTIGTVLHAGDGNIHPAILYDRHDPELVRKALDACHEILYRCIELGGSPTGEHGVGLEKREFLSLLFGAADLEAMHQLRASFDPESLCNPGKALPLSGACGESRMPKEPRT